MHEVAPDVVFFIAMSWDGPVAPPHYFRLEVDREAKALHALPPQKSDDPAPHAQPERWLSMFGWDPQNQSEWSQLGLQGGNCNLHCT